MIEDDVAGPGDLDDEARDEVDEADPDAVKELGVMRGRLLEENV